jgi:hypothetical protein
MARFRGSRQETCLLCHDSALTAPDAYRHSSELSGGFCPEDKCPGSAK